MAAMKLAGRPTVRCKWGWARDARTGGQVATPRSGETLVVRQTDRQLLWEHGVVSEHAHRVVIHVPAERVAVSSCKDEGTQGVAYRQQRHGRIASAAAAVANWREGTSRRRIAPLRVWRPALCPLTHMPAGENSITTAAPVLSLGAERCRKHGGNQASRHARGEAGSARQLRDGLHMLQL